VSVTSMPSSVARLTHSIPGRGGEILQFLAAGRWKTIYFKQAAVESVSVRAPASIPSSVACLTLSIPGRGGFTVQHQFTCKIKVL